MEIGGHSIDVSKPDKVLFPDIGLTKRDLVEYYERIGEVMVPHMRERAISMHRFPDGLDGEDFIQKAAPDYFPDWIRRERVVKEEGGSNTQIVVEDTATLVYLANQACITPHLWLSRVDEIRRPDRMIFDLDPSGGLDPRNDFDIMRRTARRLRDVLEEVELVPFVMTSGSRGLHVIVPLDRSADFDEARAFARTVADLLVRRHPGDLTLEHRKDERGDRIFVDYLRNAYAQTAVAPYAVRARPGAPVATPLAWDELGGKGLEPRRYTTRNIHRRLAQRDDPLAGISRRARSLAEPRKRLDVLLRDAPEA